MKRRLLSAFLAVMMVLTMAPVAFAADTETTTEYVAQVDGTNYETLADAIEAANNKTLTLLKDVNGQIVIPEGKTVTLDLNGNTVTAPSGRYDAVINQGTLTVTDSQKTGEIISNGNGGIGISAGSDTTIEYAKVTGREGAIGGDKSTVGAKLTINDGVFTGVDNAVVIFNGSKRDGDANKITINGGIFNGKIQSPGYIACGIYAPWKDDITVNNGTFNIENGAGIVARGGMVTVKGGEFNTTGNITGMVGDYKGTVPCSALVFDSTAGYPGMNDDSQIVVEDGKFKSDVAAVTVIKQTSDAGNRVKVTGGTFSSDVSAYVAEGYVQNNGTVEQLGETNAVAEVGGTYYKTLAEAVSAADNNTVTLLKNTVEDVVIPADKTITLDLNGKKIVNSTTAQDSKVANDARKHTITNNGTLTIMDSVGGGVVDNVSHQRAALYNNGTITEIKGGKFTRSVDNSTDSESANGNSWYVVYNAEGATISKISNGEFLALGHFSSLFSNCGTIDEISGGTFTQDHFIAFKNEGTVNKISGGVFSSTDESCIQNWGTIGEICGGTITAGSLGIWNFSSDEYKSNGTVEKISDGVISGTKAAIRLSNYDVEYLNKSADSLKNWASTTIVGGKINGALKVGNGTSVSISGGYFTVDPSAYCVTGKTGVSSGDSTYPWTVGEKIADTKPAEVADATVAATVDKNASEAAKDAAKDIGGATMAQNEAIKAATKNEANKNTIEATTKVDGDKTVAKKLRDAIGSTVADDNVKIVYQTYIDVEVKDATKENSNFTELTVELTPMYRVIAAPSTETNYNVDVDKDTSKAVNAVQIVGEKPLTLTGKYEVTLHLPNDFVVPSDNKLSIKHQKSSGVEYYTGTVTATNSATKMVTFETNGFSPFTISAVAAYVGTTAYPSLQEAANAANSGDTIVVKNGASHDLTFTATKSVKVKNETGADVTVKFNGTDKKFGDGETETFTYTKPSSGGSSGGSSSGKTTYKVTTSAVNNGGVNASPSNAEKGATITITLSPDKGYKLDKLTVTDGSGKTVSTVKKSDTVYTFTMPASAVKVGVSYVKATETPSKTKFNDVSANDWFASAVDYVTGKGMMNGTADNTFSPKANTTRGMVVTVLYRLENQPSTSAASFTDVASGAYYANAVAWANANGIVSGYGSGKFGPNDKVTREQLAAILYRYAQYKKYDVSGAKSLDGYTDAQSVSSYAVPALQWANAVGVVTGKSGNKLDPKGNATRAEVAAMLMRFCENVK